MGRALADGSQLRNDPPFVGLESARIAGARCVEGARLPDSVEWTCACQ